MNVKVGDIVDVYDRVNPTQIRMRGRVVSQRDLVYIVSRTGIATQILPVSVRDIQLGLVKVVPKEEL